MNKYSVEPTRKNENSTIKLSSQKSSNIINLTNINKSLFNKSSKNKTEKNSTFVGTINIPNRENKQNPTVLKSSYIAGALYQDMNNSNANRVYSVKNEVKLEEGEKEKKNNQIKNKYFPVTVDKNKLSGNNNIKISKTKGSFDQYQKYSVNSYDKKLPEKEINRNKGNSNNKTTNNYINDQDYNLNDSLNKKMKSLKSTSKRSGSFNNLDYKTFDLRPNSKRTLSHNMDDLGKIYFKVF